MILFCVVALLQHLLRDILLLISTILFGIEDWDSLFFLKCRIFWWWVIIFVWGLLFFGLNYRPFNAISWRIILYLSDLWFIRRFYGIFVFIFWLIWLFSHVVICVLSFWRVRIWVNTSIAWSCFRIWLRIDSSSFYYSISWLIRFFLILIFLFNRQSLRLLNSTKITTAFLFHSPTQIRIVFIILVLIP
jgi:hypothetical protein